MITEPNTSAFNFVTKPYAHQERIFNESRDLEEYALFWEMGTGKSKVIVDTARWLYLKGEIDGVLIFSDKGSYLGWHLDEISKHMDPDIQVRNVAWSSSMRSKEKRLVEEILIAKDDCLDFLCMNTESINSDRAANLARQFITNHYCLVVVDESTSIKSHRAERTKRMWKLGQIASYRRICTGTPITQSPLDLFGQCQFLRWGILGFTSFTAFRAHFAVMRKITMGPRTFEIVEAYINLDELTQRIQPFSSRILKSECLDLPEKVYETQYVEMTPEQDRLYEKFRDEALIQFDQGLLSSTNAITTINKLQQICCGHVKLDDGTEIDIPCGRLQILLNVLELIDEKVVIWCAFQRDVEQVMEKLNEPLVKGKYAVHYYGKTTDVARKLALDQIQHDPNCQWFVGTAATGGKGINALVGCRKVIYYSNTYNLEDRLQSEDRTHRIGQTRDVTYIDLVCPGTIDDRILKALRNKKDVAHRVLDEFRELLT